MRTNTAITITNLSEGLHADVRLLDVDIILWPDSAGWNFASTKEDIAGNLLIIEEAIGCTISNVQQLALAEDGHIVIGDWVICHYDSPNYLRSNCEHDNAFQAALTIHALHWQAAQADTQRLHYTVLTLAQARRKAYRARTLYQKSPVYNEEDRS